MTGGRRGKGARLRGLAVLAGALVTLSCPATAAAAPRSTPVIPEGTALWFACTQPGIQTPLGLSCPWSYDPRYLQTFLAGFDRFTPENEFNMQFLEPRQGEFDFTLADQIARFAQAYGKTIRGHTLLWSQENPPWLQLPLLPWTQSSLMDVLRQYILTVVSHFAIQFPGVVTEWDVVNEPLAPNGSLAPNVWESVLGSGYIATALELAHEADPAAKLLINEIGAESGPKAQALLALATSLKEQGVPLDAVGFEAHISPDTAPSLAALVSLFRQYAAVGLNVEVTELDVSNDGPIDNPAAKAATFERFAEACRLAGNCTGYTTWGVADPNSWLGPNTDALMYTSGYAPTPAVPIVRGILQGTLSPYGRPLRAPRRERRHRRDRRSVRSGGSGRSRRRTG